MMKIAVIGGVSSTRVLIEKLFQHGFHEVRVWGYSPEDNSLVSGWSDLKSVCERFGFRYSPFLRVSSCQEEIAQCSPDLIFAVGLSQIISEELISIPRLGCIGFHPTALPKGRGRAAIAWLVLERMDGAASFFILRSGVDDGPIVAQEPFEVDENDDAKSVEKKLLVAEKKALDTWLPKLASGEIGGVEQDHSQASWYGRRSPEDGWIDWKVTVDELLRLIKASTAPHPGAYTFHEDSIITIWSAELNSSAQKGVVGRILQVFPDQTFLVQCNDGLLRVTRWQATNSWLPRVGIRLGYYTEAEVYLLKKKYSELEERIAILEKLALAASSDAK